MKKFIQTALSDKALIVLWFGSALLILSVFLFGLEENPIKNDMTPALAAPLLTLFKMSVDDDEKSMDS